MNEAWFNCGIGVAGDMVLAALVDAGADRDEIADIVGALGVDGYELSFERVRRRSMAATQARVTVGGRPADQPLGSAADRRGDHGHDHEHAHEHDEGHAHGSHPHRPVREILALLDDAPLPPRVRRRAADVFHTIAVAEGAVHGVDPLDVELHEVGSLDAIVDVVGVCAALDALAVDRVTSSPIGVGRGLVTTAHGQLTTPAPAVAHLLAAHRIPVVGIETTMETATPTGVGIMAALADRFGAPPAMTVTNVGYGAGSADPPARPNVVTVMLGTSSVASTTGTGDGPTGRDVVVQIETNVDDVSGEILAHAVAALLGAGALDAWTSPITMKKGRPAQTVHVLARPQQADELTALLLRETGSLGARATTMHRQVVDRREMRVDVDGFEIRVKHTASRFKVEYDDAVRAAEATGRPVRDILHDAERLAREAGHDA